MSAGDKADFTVRLIDKVSGGAKSAARALDTLGSAFMGGAKAAGVADAAVGGFGSTVASFAAGDLLAHGVESAIDAFLELGAKVAETTAHLVVFGQDAEFAFNQLAKHGATGAQLFEHSSALAMRFGLDLEETTHQYEKFLGLQFSPKAIDDLIRVGADMKSLGNTAEDVQGIFLSLGEIKSIGTLQARQLLMLEQHKVSGQLVRESLAEKLGTNVEQVNALMHKGKISAELGIQAIEDAIVRKLQEAHPGEAGAKFADTTIDGIIDKFKARAKSIGLDISKPLEKPLTDLGRDMSDKLDGFLRSPKGVLTVKQIGDGLSKAAGFAMDLVSAFGSGFGDTFSKIYDGAKPFIDLFTGGDGDAAKSAFKSLAEDLGKVAAAAVWVGIGFAGLGVAFVEVVALAYNVGEGVVKAITDPLFAMEKGFSRWWGEMSSIWNNGATSVVELSFNLGKEIVIGLGRGIESLLAYPGDALMGIARNAIDAAKKTFESHSPSMVMYGIGGDVGLGLGMGIRSTAGDVADASRVVALGSVGAMSDVMSAPPVWSVGKTWGSFGAGSSFDEGRASKPIDYGPVGVSSAASPMPAADSRGASRGDTTFSPQLTVNVEGGRNPDETGDRVGAAVERRLEAWFRQLEMEG